MRGFCVCVSPVPQSSIVALWIRGCLVRNLCNGTFAVTANMEGSERSPGKQWGSQNALQTVSSVGGQLHLSPQPLCTVCSYCRRCFRPISLWEEVWFLSQQHQLSEKCTMPRDRVKRREMADRSLGLKAAVSHNRRNFEDSDFWGRHW